MLLWSRTSVDWTWRDSVAGLWAFVETNGKEVSRRPGSPVAKVAVAIGRAVSGVYNKVMNFRSLNPADVREGLSGAGDTDREVWAKFFDAATGEVNRLLLQEELDRLNLKFNGAQDEAAAMHEVPALDGTLESLIKRYMAGLDSGAFMRRPTLVGGSAAVFVRNPFVVDITRLRAKHACEVPGCAHPTFEADDGRRFIEVHHVIRLADGGEDVVENTVCLCPNHHREAHHGKHRERLKVRLLDVCAARRKLA